MRYWSSELLSTKTASWSAAAWLAGLLLVICASHICAAQEAPSVGENLLQNGTFETDADGDGSPDGWSKRKGLSLARSEGRNGTGCLKCASTDSTGGMTVQVIELPAEAALLRVSGWARFRNVVQGDRGWKVARVNLTYHDGEEKRIGGWPIAAQWTGSSNWVDFETDIEVPEGAVTVRVNAGLLGCNGTIWLDDFSVAVLTPPEPLPGLFPFYVPWDDASPGVTNVSWLNEKPAGKHGRVQIRNGHFVDGRGRRIRFLGTNACFEAGFPTREDAEKVAARIARFGINVVRFHHMDSAYAPRGIWDPKYKDRRHIDKQQLDRLDYFIAQLKKNGIYSNLNLHVGRKLRDVDGGVPFADRLPKYDKGVGNFWPRMIELQKEYARDLLAHTNPYTGSRYADEPALLCVEISNEDSLISFIKSWGGIDSLPAPYQEYLDKRWNEWLARKYRSTERMKAAWAKGEEVPGGGELLQNGNFSTGKEHWAFQVIKPGRATFEIEQGAFRGGPAARITVERVSKASWHIQFTQMGLSFKKGKSYSLSFFAKADGRKTIQVNNFTTKAPWRTLGFRTNVTFGTEWKEYTFGFKASEDYDDARITIGRLALETGTVWLAGFSMQEGGVIGLPQGESVERSSVTRPSLSGRGLLRTSPALEDVSAFYIALEKQYWQEMYDYLKRDLRVKAPVTGTQVYYSPLTTQEMMDFYDTHAYWQHPRFPGRPWDRSNWSVRNISMVNDGEGGTLRRLAHGRPAGKPYTVSEYNHPAPNTYSVEAYLLLATYGALQDWDGIYQFAYGKSSEKTETRMQSYFELHSHTHKLVTLPAVAMIFRRPDVSAARKTLAPAFNLGDAIEGVSLGHKALYAYDKGVPGLSVLEHKVEIRYPGEGTVAGAAADPSVNRSDTGELVWDRSDAGKGVVTVNSAKSKAVIGFSSGRRFDLGAVVVAPGENLQGWSAITLTVVEGDDFKAARSILIAATGYVQNKGWSWKDLGNNRVTLGPNWGRGPILVEGIPAEITVPCRAGKLSVYALDQRGQRKRKVPATRRGGRWNFRVGPEYETLWYEVAAE